MRNKVINIRLTNEEHAVLKEQARITGHSKAAIMRKAWRDTHTQDDLDRGEWSKKR